MRPVRTSSASRWWPTSRSDARLLELLPARTRAEELREVLADRLRVAAQLVHRVAAHAAHHADATLLECGEHGAVGRRDRTLHLDARLAGAVAHERALRAAARVHLRELAVDDDRIRRYAIPGHDRDVGERPHRLQLCDELVGEDTRRDRLHLLRLVLL